LQLLVYCFCTVLQSPLQQYAAHLLVRAQARMAMRSTATDSLGVKEQQAGKRKRQQQQEDESSDEEEGGSEEDAEQQQQAAKKRKQQQKQEQKEGEWGCGIHRHRVGITDMSLCRLGMQLRYLPELGNDMRMCVAPRVLL
jgi:hemolysin activation/secretion protein